MNFTTGPNAGFGPLESQMPPPSPRCHPGIYKVSNQGWLSGVYDRDTETLLASVYHRDAIPAPQPKDGWFDATYPRRSPPSLAQAVHACATPPGPFAAAPLPQREDPPPPRETETRHFMSRLLERSRAEEEERRRRAGCEPAGPAFGRPCVGTAPVEGPPIEWDSPAASPQQTPTAPAEPLKGEAPVAPGLLAELLTPRGAPPRSALPADWRRGPRASGEARDLRQEVQDLTKDLRATAIRLQDLCDTQVTAGEPVTNVGVERSEFGQGKGEAVGSDQMDDRYKVELAVQEAPASSPPPCGLEPGARSDGACPDLHRETGELGEELAAIKRMRELVGGQAACDEFTRGNLSRTLWDMQAACDGLARGSPPQKPTPKPAREMDFSRGQWKEEGKVLIL